MTKILKKCPAGHVLKSVGGHQLQENKEDELTMNYTKVFSLINSILTGAMIFFLLAGSSFAAEYGSIVKDGVNIRSGPNTKSDVLWEVFKGYPVEILQRQGEWAQIKDFEGDTGWLYTSLLSKEKTVIVKVETANLRNAPATDGKIVATVKKGVVFTPLEQKGTWMKVKYKNEIIGWISNTLIFPPSM